MTRLISNLLMIVGSSFLIISAFFLWERVNPERLKFENVEEFLNNGGQEKSIRPVFLEIKDLKINLPIYEAEIIKGRWQATTKGISYLSSSGIPGEVGNSILYSHNWSSLLGPLTKAKPGQKIIITFDNGRKEKFVVEHTQEVGTDNTEILSQTEDSRLTLYTCSGFLDTKRFVVSAFPVKDQDETF